MLPSSWPNVRRSFESSRCKVQSSACENYSAFGVSCLAFAICCVASPRAPGFMELAFDHDPTEAKTAMVAAFDLGGFSQFCCHPDAPVVIPKLAAALFNLLKNYTQGTPQTSFAALDGEKMRKPTHVKFTGDGALLLWLNPLGRPFAPDERTRLVRAFL